MFRPFWAVQGQVIDCIEHSAPYACAVHLLQVAGTALAAATARRSGNVNGSHFGIKLAGVLRGFRLKGLPSPIGWIENMNAAIDVKALAKRFVDGTGAGGIARKEAAACTKQVIAEVLGFQYGKLDEVIVTGKPDLVVAQAFTNEVIRLKGGKTNAIGLHTQVLRGFKALNIGLTEQGKGALPVWTVKYSTKKDRSRDGKLVRTSIGTVVPYERPLIDPASECFQSIGKALLRMNEYPDVDAPFGMFIGQIEALFEAIEEPSDADKALLSTLRLAA